MKLNFKRKRHITTEQSQDYKKAIANYLKVKPNVQTVNLQKWLNESFDINLSRRTVRKYKQELKDNPLPKPNTAIERVQSEIEQHCIEKAIEKQEIKDKISEKQLKRDLKKHKMCRDVFSDLMFYWSKPCFCGHCAKIYAGHKTQTAICIQCGAKYNRDTDTWSKMM